jgi:hypothetical protein
MTMRRRGKIAKVDDNLGRFRHSGDWSQMAFAPRSGLAPKLAFLGLVMVLAACATKRAPTSEELYDAEIKKCDALAPPFDATKASDPDYLSQMNEAITQQQKCYFQANVNLESRDQHPAPNLETLQKMGGSLEPTGQQMMPAIAPPPEGSPSTP